MNGFAETAIEAINLFRIHHPAMTAEAKLSMNLAGNRFP
ncbi:MAG: hypothetical protein JWM91_4463 [Rhodospirillales bacterium]|nr:hypothetical protein [Rhodospirillales bacterium]